MLTKFFKEEEGMATIEIVLIVIVVIGLVIAFRGAITQALKTITDTVQTALDGFKVQ